MQRQGHPAVQPPACAAQARFQSFPKLYELLEQADAVLLLGTDLSYQETGYRDVSTRGQVIQVDVDPEQIGANLHADRGIIGDAGATAAALCEALSGHHPARGMAEEISVLRAEMDAAERAMNDRYQQILRTLHSTLDAHAVVVNDMTQVCYRAQEFFPVDHPRQFLFPQGLGTLGYSLPVALGAKLAHPGRQVIALSGNGGFQFTLQELATAVQYRIPLPVVLCNSNSYAQIAWYQQQIYGREFQSDLVNPDLIALAEAYGAQGVRINNIAEGSPADHIRGVCLCRAYHY